MGVSEYHKHANLQPLVGEISWVKHVIIMGKTRKNRNSDKKFDIVVSKEMI